MEQLVSTASTITSTAASKQCFHLVHNQTDFAPEARSDANEDALAVVGDDAVGVEGQEGGDEDQEHDVDEGEDVVLKLVAHKVGHVRHGAEGARGLEGVVVAHPHLLPAVGDHLDRLGGNCDQPLGIDHHLSKTTPINQACKQTSNLMVVVFS